MTSDLAALSLIVTLMR